MQCLDDKSPYGLGLFYWLKEQVLIKLIQSHYTINFIAAQMRRTSYF